MKIAIFDAKGYDKEFFDKENKENFEISYFEEDLTLETVGKTKGFDAVSLFVNTVGDEKILKALAENGVKYWFQRSMGYNKIDLKAAKEVGVKVFRVSNYSAETVSEHGLTLMLTLNRRILEAKSRTQKCNFSLDGLQGKCINDSVVGVVGAGKIGQGFIKAVVGMGARVLVSDDYAKKNNPDLAKNIGFEWSSFDDLLPQADFISLHAPLLESTKHIINKDSIAKMKDGVILINVARGGLVNTTDLVAGLKSGKIKGAGIDVLEREEGRFFFDRCNVEHKIKKDDPEWKYLLESKNVILTAHQAFFSTLALSNIAESVLKQASMAKKGDFSTELLLLEDGRVQNG